MAFELPLLAAVRQEPLAEMQVGVTASCSGCANRDFAWAKVLRADFPDHQRLVSSYKTAAFTCVFLTLVLCRIAERVLGLPKPYQLNGLS